MKRLLMISCVVTSLLTVVGAQTASQGQQPPPTPAPTAQGQRPAAPPAAGSPATPQASTWQNIKLDITITDAASTSPQIRKVLSLYIADARQGQVRSQNEQGLINVDARPQVRPDGRTILLQLTVEYRPDARGSLFSESLSALVVDGKPLMLSQTVDPSGDRKVSVEVLATIQKN
jgi:hypothetical protein